MLLKSEKLLTFKDVYCNGNVDFSLIIYYYTNILFYPKLTDYSINILWMDKCIFGKCKIVKNFVGKKTGGKP
jgi:hypothetical protein